MTLPVRVSFLRCAAFACLLFTLVGCVRPDSGPSPFDFLSEATATPRPLPASPVAGPNYPIIPDAELVFGPTTLGWDIQYEIISRAGFLASYKEEVNGEVLSGAQIVEMVARDYSVHPRLLLAFLAYTGGWIGAADAQDYPLYPAQDTDMILFRQLSYLANTLNYGFYARRVGGLPSFKTLDGVEILLAADVNDASAAVQFALAQLLGYFDWDQAVGPAGLRLSFTTLFGDPFAFDQTLLPDGLAQPAMLLPFAPGESWFFTSGPHSAWGTGAAWAALDFAPDEEGWGCYEAASWVTAVADGRIVRIADGIVVQDLDDDGAEGTGWTVLYMHIADLGKVQLGQEVQAGERIGHPSCAGGPSTGSHLHLARRYNGEWIPADQDIPFNLSGWVSRGDGLEYDGTLSKGALEIEASGYPGDENKVIH